MMATWADRSQGVRKMATAGHLGKEGSFTKHRTSRVLVCSGASRRDCAGSHSFHCRTRARKQAATAAMAVVATTVTVTQQLRQRRDSDAHRVLPALVADQDAIHMRAQYRGHVPAAARARPR